MTVCEAMGKCLSVRTSVGVLSFPLPIPEAAKCAGRAGRQGACPAGFPHASSGAAGSKGLYALSGRWGLARVENARPPAQGPPFCRRELEEVRA